MAQKSPILLHAEAKSAFIQTINYFLQQGIASYELKSIIDSVMTELNTLVESDLKKAEEEYKAALEAEKNQTEDTKETTEE